MDYIGNFDSFYLSLDHGGRPRAVTDAGFRENGYHRPFFSVCRGPLMAIWVDADACPRVIRDILFRAAERCQTPLTLVANQPIDVPRSRYIQMLQVARGFDVADNEIADRIQPGDLVVTADIPLAAAAIERKAEALSPRGERFTTDNIRERLNLRDFMDTLRASGLAGGGPPALSASDRHAFANGLDRYLSSRDNG